MTVASKLQVLAAIKAAQYAAIIGKGGTVTQADWGAYAAAIDALPSGGGAYNPDFPSPIFMGLPSTGFVNGTEPTGKAWYVRPGGAGDKDGRDWDNAFATREDAIVAASAGDHIRVMEGLYYIGTMQIPKLGVSEFYGFTQADGTWATRNPWLHPSRLDACYTSNRWDNDSVVFALGQMVDGLWVQNVFGGNGITSLQPGTFRNVSTVNCTGATNGGGMYFATGAVDRAFATKCSASNGGGIYTTSGGSLTNAVVTNCGGSGGVYIDDGNSSGVYVRNCQVGLRFRYGIHENGIVVNCSIGLRSSAFGESSYGGLLRNCIAINCGSNTRGVPAYGGIQNMAAVNCIAINCGRGFSVASSINCTAVNCSGYGFTFGSSGVAMTIRNSVSYGSPIYAGTSNAAYKIYNCASNFALSGISGWDTNADVRDFLTLTDFPFAAPGIAPWDALGPFNENLAKGEESLAFIDRVVLPSVADAHLPTGSPLIGAGYYQAGVTPDTDADGKARPLTPSIGAYEP